MFTPAAASTSALPHCEETERLPCLATRTPAPAATNAAAVEMLNERDLSPPVPQESCQRATDGHLVHGGPLRDLRGRQAGLAREHRDDAPLRRREVVPGGVGGGDGRRDEVGQHREPVGQEMLEVEQVVRGWLAWHARSLPQRAAA